jgi:cytidylate kinase
MYFVTVSDMLGTDGGKVAKVVAQRLGYAFYGEAELASAATGMGLPLETKTFDEKSPDFFSRYFSGKPKVSLDRLQAVILDLAKRGDAVFHGRGSQVLLRSFDCALHVLVTGSMNRRKERLVAESALTGDVAERILTRSDVDKGGFLRYAFDEDWLNPGLYDLIINTDKMSVESAAKMVIEAARSDEIKACGIDSAKALGKLALTRLIESTLIEEGLMSSHVFFTVEDEETVHVFGLVASAEERDKVERVLERLKNVRAVRSFRTLKNDLGVFTRPMDL